MGYWNSRGLRGSALEDMVNRTNNMYERDGLAIVQKIPTPITPTKFDSQRRLITEAYFEQKSTVDYIGVCQGIPICFDAKQVSKKNIPLQNIHEHQIDFMKKFVEQRGIAFLLVNFTETNESFYLPFEVLEKYWLESKEGGRKSIPYDAFEEKYLIKNKQGYFLHYLEPLDKYLVEKGL